MQITIDKKTGVLLAIIALLGATVVSFAINGKSDQMGGMGGHESHNSSNSNYTGADIMFLQMMIPHHQQAIDISNLAMKTSKDSELLALAKKISIIAAGVFNSGVLANPVEGAYYDYEIAPQEILEKARAIAKFLEKFNVTLPQAALQFPLRHPAVTTVLTGSRSSKELLANIADFDSDVPQEAWTALEAAGLIPPID